MMCERRERYIGEYNMNRFEGRVAIITEAYFETIFSINVKGLLFSVHAESIGEFMSGPLNGYRN